MSEMKVGDIGVLQNIKSGLDSHSEPDIDISWLNGYFAEILPLPPKNPGADYSVRVLGAEVVAGRSSTGEYKGTYGIKKHQIRPLADPDHTETTTEEEVEA